MAVEILVGFAITRVNDLLKVEVDLLSGVKSQVQSLQTELMWMQSYLKDADSRYEQGDERFRTSIQEIRTIAYDVEDLVDFFILESCSRKRRNPLIRYVSIFQHLVRTHQFGTSISSIKERIHECTERLVRYGVRISDGDSLNSGSRNDCYKQSRIHRAYPHVEDDDVVGLDEDIEALVGQLVDQESTTRVVSIVGMGGSGKTTLARQIYNSSRVKLRFGSRAWVSISQSWDRRDVLLEIFRQVVDLRGEDIGGSDQELLEKLYVFLKERVYLIVLDDIWKLEAWEDVFPALPRNKGSKVLLTTRNESVSLLVDPNSVVHNPRMLDEDESWELFRRKVFVNAEMDSEYVKIGKEMVRKCGGLPLAVAALGGLLRTKKGLDEWERIHKALPSNIMKGKGSLLYGRVDKMLSLSYDDLPYDLKPCFLYLGIFPEDSEIKIGMLIRMWIVEGFIRSDNLLGEESLEDVAREYLDELIHRCLLQVARRNHAGKVTRCRMHDLIRDLCVKKAKEQDFLQILSPTSHGDTSSVQARRVAIPSGNSFPEQRSNLRSLIQIRRVAKTAEVPTKSSLDSICTNFKFVRVLNLWGLQTHHKALPDQIGTLIHLKYLGIKLTNITELPRSIGNLHNLLTLDYRWIKHTTNYVKVPDVLWNMEQLKYLYLPWGAMYPNDKLGIDNLQQLQTLWGVGGGNWITKELARSSQRIRKLAISNVSGEDQLEAVFGCPSVVLGGLHSFELSWFSIHSNDIFDTELPRLELGHCEHLRSLILQGRMKEGLHLCFPPNLTKLELYWSQLQGKDPMETLGKLPNLKILWLCYAYMGTQMSCKTGMFPRLENLMLSNLVCLQELGIEEGAISHLNKLIISHCEELTRLPEGLRFSTNLQQLVLRSMPLHFVKTIRRAIDGEATTSEEEEYMFIVQSIPSIQIC